MLAIDKAKEQYPSINPRFVLFCWATNQTPESFEQRELADGRSYMIEFILWMSPRIRAFQDQLIAQGAPRSSREILVLMHQNKFDEFLSTNP
jgi:hypothetical protein